ncbi:MAG: Flp pilus assembly complex ATPase component TadA [Brachyspira sp.]|nr:Flp pilus assembly complex ATPase component TadA [Brachyspira sp.]
MGFKDRFKTEEVSEMPAEPVQVTDGFSDFDELIQNLSEKVSAIPVWFEYSEKEKLELIKAFVDKYLRDEKCNLGSMEFEALCEQLSNSVYGFGKVDILLADDKIRSICIRKNKSVLVEKEGSLIETGMMIEKADVLAARLLNASKINTGKSVLKFGYKNLIITVVMPPVSDFLITIKKNSRDKTDFNYLVNNGFIDKNIFEFLSKLINEKNSILLSGCADSGKTSYIEAFLGLNSKYTLFQMSNILHGESFVCEGLADDDIENLENCLKYTVTDYVVYDLNCGYTSRHSYPLISTIRAESVFDAVTKLSARFSQKEKLTEKQAKAKIADLFDYVIQLDKEMFIDRISECSLNKSGSLVLTDVLVHEQNGYMYNLPSQGEVPLQTDTPGENLPKSFKERFK